MANQSFSVEEQDMLQLNEMYRRPLRDLGFHVLPIKPPFTQDDVMTEHKLMQKRLNVTKLIKEARGREKSTTRERQKTCTINRNYEYPDPLKGYHFLQ